MLPIYFDYLLLKINVFVYLNIEYEKVKNEIKENNTESVRNIVFCLHSGMIVDDVWLNKPTTHFHRKSVVSNSVYSNLLKKMKR